MSTEDVGPKRAVRKVKKGKEPASPAWLTPAAHAQALEGAFIASLEADKANLAAEVQRLQAKIEQLGPENARLRESLRNERSNNTFATILIVVGGVVVSYATYLDKSAQTNWANAGLACLLAGICSLLWQTVQRR